MRLSIIVITWNEIVKTRNCLASLVNRIDHKIDEVILVDNGSEDGTEEMVASEFPRVKYLRLSKNIGVGPARNRGMCIANGEYLMTLDNDALLHTDDPGCFINSLFKANPEVGLIGFKLINPDGSRQSSARRFPKIYQPLAARLRWTRRFKTLRDEMASHLMKDIDFNNMAPSELIDVDYVLGANQVFSRKLAVKIGGYDENIFFGPEDAEFCLRIKKLGIKVVYSNDIVITHEYQRRTRKLGRLAFKHLQGFFYTFIKHRCFYRLVP
jgi:GT2 family glycosyltransferase